VAIQIAMLLGVPQGLAYLAGIMSVVGHRFPVFTGFRGGGRGMAACGGMIVYGAAVAFASGWLSLADFGVLAAVAAVSLGVTR
jgi:glycerol-3-phosphate acyltransferase PlsY